MNAGVDVLVVTACAVLGVLGGLAVPPVVRRLPVQPVDTMEVDGVLDPDGLLDAYGPERPHHAPAVARPDFPAIAAAWYLGGWCALIGAVGLGLLGWLAPAIAFPSALIVAVAALPLGYVDLREHLLPERILWPTAAVVLGVVVVQAAVLSRWTALLTAIIVAAVCFVVFLLLAVVAGGGFGFGDVQLVTVLVLSAGWVSVGTAVLAVVLAIAADGVMSLVLLLARRIGRRQAVAFGPFLLLGWWAAMLLTSSLAPTG